MDRAHIVEPATGLVASKAKIRRAIEAEGIPYTCVASNCFAGFFLPALNRPSSGGLGSFLQPNVHGATASHSDKRVILGDGNVQGNSIS